MIVVENDGGAMSTAMRAIRAHESFPSIVPIVLGKNGYLIGYPLRSIVVTLFDIDMRRIARLWSGRESDHGWSSDRRLGVDGGREALRVDRSGLVRRVD